MNRSTPGLPVHHQLPEFTQTRVHKVSDTIQPSHLLSSPSSPVPNPSQHKSLYLFQYPIILPFHTVHFKARILKRLPFPSPVDHILSDLSTMTRLSWVALRALFSFIELDKAAVLVD